MERALIRIDLVVTTKNEAHTDVDQLVAGEQTTLHRIPNTVLNGPDVLLRNGATRDLVFEDKPFARSRLDLDLDVTKLAATAGLLLVNLFAGRGLRNRLAISNLRLADVGLDAKLALHAIDDDLEMKLAHAGNDCLSGFMIG